VGTRSELRFVLAERSQNVRDVEERITPDLRVTGMTGFSANSDVIERHASLRCRDLKPRRFDHDARISSETVIKEGRCTRLRTFLTDREVHNQVAPEARADLAHEQSDCQDRCESALHIAGTTAIDVSVAKLTREWIGEPARRLIDSDGIHVTVQHEAPASWLAVDNRGYRLAAWQRLHSVNVAVDSSKRVEELDNHGTFAVVRVDAAYLDESA
jgi:hypothetical protein